MTSVFRLIFKNFDPPATVDSAGVRPASEHVGVEDIPTLKRDFAHLAAVSRERMRKSRTGPMVRVVKTPWINPRRAKGARPRVSS